MVDYYLNTLMKLCKDYRVDYFVGWQTMEYKVVDYRVRDARLGKVDDGFSVIERYDRAVRVMGEYLKRKKVNEK